MTPLTSSRARPLLIWGGFCSLLLVAPLIFTQSAALSVLSQIGSMMIFALSFNMLLGQTGMLSFGHAVFAGLGAFVALHLMNALSGSSPAWLLLVPLAGGVAGLLFGAIFGFIATRKSGVALSMISLGLVELVGASALMFPGFFGGESGVGTDRVLGPAILGIDFGTQIQVYYLIAFWVLVSVAGMYLLTQTPLGRIANAVRDNPERAAFIGYDPRQVRYLMFMLSAFFAGIAGTLAAINVEIVSAENLGLQRSAQVLLFTYIGGVGYFCGPIIGAVVGVLFSVVLSAYTKAWQLYLGLLFMLVVLVAPGGIAALVPAVIRAWHALTWRQCARLSRPFAALIVGLLLCLFCGVALIEMLYQMAEGVSASRAAPIGWPAVAMHIALIAVGGLMLGYAKPRLQQLLMTLPEEAQP